MARGEVKSAAMRDFEALLNGFDEKDPNDLAMFNELLGQILEEALPELSDRMIRPSTSRGLKHLILASASKFPHSDWTPLLNRALMHETDSGLFEEGCRALVQTGGTRETDALRQIAWQRQEPDLQAIVSRKLIWLEARQPFGYHFRDLLQGSKNPRASAHAAQHLAVCARLENLEDLIGACDNPDNLVSTNALKVIASLQNLEAGRFLVERFNRTCDLMLMDAWLRSAQEQIKRAMPQAVKGVILDLLRSRPGAERHETALQEIDAALDEPEGDALPLIQRLLPQIEGVREVRLVDCLADLAIGHSVRINNLIPETLEEFRQRSQWQQANLDACAEGLAMYARRGIMGKEIVLPLLQRAFEGNVGGDGLGIAFVEILENGDQAQLDLILASSNHRWREEAIKILGERGSPELLPFFIRASADPIVDNAQLAIRCLGKLPGAMDLAMELFQSGRADQIERALSIFSLNHMTEAGPVLVEFLSRAEREDVLSGTVRCLGELQFQPAIGPLLEMLRGGQSLRLLKTIAETLVACDSAEAAFGLLQKAQEVKNLEIHLLAIEGIAKTHPDFHQGLSSEEAFLLERSLDACFEEGGSTRVKAVSALQDIWTIDDAWYERFESRLGKWVAEQKKRPTWDRDQQQVITNVLRDLERKRRALGGLLSSGNRLRQKIMAYTPGAPDGAKVMHGLIETLQEPGIFLGLDIRNELTALIGSELERSGTGEAVMERLCELSGQIQSAEAQGQLMELLHRTSQGSSLHLACVKALIQLGCGAESLNQPLPMRKVLVMDPSGFFRKRIINAMQSREVSEAQEREEAEAILRESAVDLLISEVSDTKGDLQEWFASMWRHRRIRQVILSTTSREYLDLLDQPWIMGALLKPYPVEDLLALLGE